MICIVPLALASAMHSYALVDWWKPVAVCVLAASILNLVSGRVVRWFTGSTNRWINSVVSIVACFSIAAGTFYTLNSSFADASTQQEVKATVVRKYSEKHYRTRRLSRNRAVRGEAYYRYYVELELPDGRHKPLEVSTDNYVHMRRGQTMTLYSETGLFGIPVIRRKPVVQHVSRF